MLKKKKSILKKYNNIYKNVVIAFNAIIEGTLYKTAHNNHLKGAPVSPLMVHTYFLHNHTKLRVVLC